MKNLFVLATLLTAGAYSASAQTTTTTDRTTTTSPATTPDQTVTPSSTTTHSQTTTTDNSANQSSAVQATTDKGKTMIEPAPGAKVKGNGKRIKIK